MPSFHIATTAMIDFREIFKTHIGKLSDAESRINGLVKLFVHKADYKTRQGNTIYRMKRKDRCLLPMRKNIEFIIDETERWIIGVRLPPWKISEEVVEKYMCATNSTRYETMVTFEQANLRQCEREYLPTCPPGGIFGHPIYVGWTIKKLLIKVDKGVVVDCWVLDLTECDYQLFDKWLKKEKKKLIKKLGEEVEW